MKTKVHPITYILLCVSLFAVVLTGCSSSKSNDLKLTKTLPISKGKLSASHLADNSFIFEKNGREDNESIPDSEDLEVWGTLLEIIDVDGNILISLGSDSNNPSKKYGAYLGEGYYLLITDTGEAEIVKDSKEIYHLNSTESLGCLIAL
ncbi:MAG: hypothetical protein FWG14_02020 [Peptococcaceae bacterium]|nr:hypothetical protein [Peptococcaceae bacterium]